MQSTNPPRPGQRPDRIIRACSAQMAPVWEEPEKTLAKAEILIRDAAAGGADIICFPEQVFTGWDPVSHEHIQDSSGMIVSFLKKAARDAGIAIIGSIRERSVPSPRNTAVVISSEGTILTTYAKIHLFSPALENTAFSPGTRLGTFTLGTLKCGLAICYDLRFPEVFSAYAAEGVQAVFVPSAWPASRIRHWELFITARAAENQMYVIGVNTTGKTPVDIYDGTSMTADPNGALISHAGDAEQLIFSAIDPAVADAARSAFPVGKDRRVALYRDLA
ncbi:MAG: carbon-nitrogen hydrolase family protein [Methanomicrobiales archaeon]|nr:carbon-nitrogen hydrolase family protein [Methanomicrobiales archaeon]